MVRSRGIDIIGVRAPHLVGRDETLYENYSDVTTPFGTHIGKAINDPWKEIAECGGTLDLSRDELNETSPDEGSTRKGSPIVKCSDCDFSLVLNQDWHWVHSYSQWMQMAFWTTLTVLFKKDWRFERHQTQKAYQSFLPRERTFYRDQAIKVLDRYHVAHTLGEWPSFSVLIAPLDLQDPHSLQLLLLNSGVMLSSMEEKFQDATKKAMRQINSASGIFHLPKR